MGLVTDQWSGRLSGIFWTQGGKQGWDFNHRFLIELLVFCDQKIDFLVKKIESLPSIFLKVDRIDSLMVDLFKRSTGSI